MNKQIKKISELLRLERLKNDQRIVLFLICLLIATVLWFLNALSKDYTTTFSYSVKYTDAPSNLFLSNTPPGSLDLKVEAHGFTLLRHKLMFSVSPLVLNLAELKNEGEESGTSVIVRTENIIEQVSVQVSNEIKVVDISPETIRLVFDSLQTKNVKIIADIDLNLEKQYFLSGDVLLEPGSVQITGPSGLLDTLNFLRTKKLKFENLDVEVKRSVSIIHPEKTEIQPIKTNLIIPVERFTEKKIRIPITLKNIPEGTNVKIFPSVADVSFLVGLSDYENISASDFKVVADFDSARNKETLEVVVEEKPDFIQQLRVSPQNVEFLIETD